MQKKEELTSLPYTATAEGMDQVVFDLGGSHQVRSFYYQPMQGDSRQGLVANYAIYAGNDKDHQQLVASGEFSNIRNNPVMQEVFFTPTSCRYLTFKATRMVNPGDKMAYKQIIIK